MTALISLGALTAIFALVFYFYNDYRVDKHRQRIFEIRDSLFDAASAGQISFESQAYKVTRATLNGMIRFGHRVSFTGLFIANAGRKSRSSLETIAVIQRAFDASSPADRDLCLKTMERAHIATVQHLASSPLVYILILPGLLVAFGVVTATKVSDWCQSQLRALDASAFSEGRA